MPSRQYDPTGHADGVTVPDTHTLPTGHTLHTLLPGWSWYVPAAHARGEELPTAHDDPTGHSKLDTDVGSAVPDGQ